MNDKKLRNAVNIYKRGIALTIMVTMTLCFSRLAYMIFATSLKGIERTWWQTLIAILSKSIALIPQFLTEWILIFSGLTILIIGFVNFRSKDEMSFAYEKHQFYLLASKIYLLIGIVAGGMSIPFYIATMDATFQNTPVMYVLFVLIVIVFGYLMLAFKKHQIYFNESFIFEHRHVYYRRVWSKIGMLGILMCVLLVISCGIDWIVYRRFDDFLEIFIGLLLFYVSLSFLYLFVSFLERVSYEEEKEPQKYHYRREIIVIAVALAVIQLAMWFLRTISSWISFATGYVGIVEMGKIIAQLSYWFRDVSYIEQMLLMMGFAYLLIPPNSSRIVQRSTQGYIGVTMASVWLGAVGQHIWVLCIDAQTQWEQAISVTKTIQYVRQGIDFTFWALLFALWVMWVCGWQKDARCRRPKLLWSVVALELLSYVVATVLPSFDTFTGKTWTVTLSSISLVASLLMIGIAVYVFGGMKENDHIENEEERQL